MKRTFAYLSLMFLLLVTSCLRYDGDGESSLYRSADVAVAVDPLDDPLTRSAVTAQDEKAVDYNIWIYDGDGLVFDGYYVVEETERIRIDSLVVGTVYQVRALANVGEVAPPATVAAADAMILDWDISGLNDSDGIPMAARTSFTMAMSASVDLHLKRIAAKYTFVIDRQGFTGTYTIRSAQLCNAPSGALVFAESGIGVAGITATNGDYATEADLERLNSGLGVHYFIYENNQGELLPGNTDQWKKEFENHNTGMSSYASKCSYLDVMGDYEMPGLKVPDLRYRIYLGKNATTNFDVSRNTAYTVALRPTDATAVDRNLVSWKLTHGTISDTRTIAFNPSSITVPTLGQASSSVTVSPSSIEYTVFPGENFEASGLSFVRSGNSVTVKSDSLVWETRSARLKASLFDGKSAELDITVTPPEIDRIEVVPADGWTLVQGQTKAFSAIAHFKIGASADVTDRVIWSGSRMDVQETKGLFRASSASFGAASVTATLGGMSGSSNGTVIERVSVKTEPCEPQIRLSYSGKVGANGSATGAPSVTYTQKAKVTYNDDSTEEITLVSNGNLSTAESHSFSGTAKNSSGAAIAASDGKVSGKNRGTTPYTSGVVFTATVTLKSNGVTGTATADVYQQSNEETYGAWTYAGQSTETVYDSPSVSISASPTNLPAAGGTSTLSYSASYRQATKTSWTGRSRSVSYTSGATATQSEGSGSETGTYTSMSGTPTITDNGAGGFSRSGATVTAEKNISVARSLICYADFKDPAGHSATQKSVTITQASGRTYGISVDSEILIWTATQYGSENSKSVTVTVSSSDGSDAGWGVLTSYNFDTYFSYSKSGNTLTIWPVKENKTTSTVTGDITIYCEQSTGVRKTINLTQQAGTITYRLVCSGGVVVKKGYTEPTSATMKYYTITNGVSDAGKSVFIYQAIFSTADASIATVSKSGSDISALLDIKGVGVGTTKIYATYKGISSHSADPELDSGITVTVYDSSTDYDIVIE